MSSISPGRLSELIHTLYAAAENPDLWSEFLESVAEQVSSRMTVLVAASHTDGKANISTAVRANPEAIRLYNEGWSREDVWINSGHETITRPGAVVYTEEIISDGKLVKTGYYNDFMRRFDMFHAVTATILADPQMSAGLSCHYPRSSPAPGKEVFELLGLLTPHLAQALRFHERWRALATAEQAATEAADRVSIGFLLLDGTGRILRMNRFAEDLLRRSDGLRSVRGRLRATRWNDDRELEAAIARVAETALRSGLHTGRTLPVARPQGAPYLLTLTPVSAKGALFGEHRAAMVALVSDPAREPSVSTLRMQRLLGWTQAEAEVAGMLLAGHSTREIAEKRGVGSETIRVQLKSLYRKAGVSGQAQLVRLLMAGGPALERRQL